MRIASRFLAKADHRWPYILSFYVTEAWGP